MGRPAPSEAALFPVIASAVLCARLSALVESGLYPESVSGIGKPARAGNARTGIKVQMHFDAANAILPIATRAAGVFLMIAPRIVSFAVAVYLIFVGLFGLNGIYHIIK
jgi:hypothetical protein